MPSRQEKKRAKRRAKYLEVRDDVLESARASYKADPEKKRTGERERYHADPVKLNAKAMTQTQKRNGQLNAKAMKQTQKRNGQLNAKAIKQTQKRNGGSSRSRICASYLDVYIKRMRTRLRRHNHVGDRVPILYRWKEMKMEKQRYNSHWV